MEKHPGGMELTKRLLELGGLTGEPDSDQNLCILDMGAGAGHAVRFLRTLGFDAVGIDLHPETDLGCDTECSVESLSDAVISGDFLHCPFPDQSFDFILSECAFYVSGNPSGAIQEAFRLLKQGGCLLLADVSYASADAHTQMLTSAGFKIRALEDLSALWKEYYIYCIWNGTADLLCPRREKGTCYYYLTVCERM